MQLPVLREINGLIAYEGPSLINQQKIVAIVTGLNRRSENIKTGDMLQTWILLADRHPLDAWKAKQDEAVCGGCIHRQGSCYVSLNHGPASVWNTYRRGGYVPLKDRHLKLFNRRLIRLGSYGDPAAVPFQVWERLVKPAAGHTGYTHAWRTCNPDLRQWCMASCDSPQDAEDAKARGWKPFLVRPPGSPVPEGFFTCPASKEAGYRLTCQQCMACHGGEWNGRQGLPTIQAHGGAVKMNVYRKRVMPTLAA